MKEFKIIIGIYKITSPSGKIYIGQSVDIYDRWVGYVSLECKKQRKLYNSLKKYGAENHTFEIITTLEVDDEHELDWLEIYFIHSFDSFNTPHGMNLTEGGSNGRRSDETKKKMSEAQKGEKSYWFGKKQSKETIDNRVKKNTGKKRNDEFKNKQSEIMSGENHPMFGKKQSSETKDKSVETRRRNKEEKIANGTYVKKTRSAETRKKMSESHKGKKSSAESIAKGLETFNNKTQSEKNVIIKKMIETKRKNKEEKISNGTYVEYNHSEKTIKKMSDAKKNKKQIHETVSKRIETRRKNKEAKIANGTYVKPVVSAETKKKQSEATELYWKNIHQEKLTMIF